MGNSFPPNRGEALFSGVAATPPIVRNDRAGNLAALVESARASPDGPSARAPRVATSQVIIDGFIIVPRCPGRPSIPAPLTLTSRRGRGCFVGLFGRTFLNASIAQKDIAVNGAAGENFFGVGFLNVWPGAQQVTYIRGSKPGEVAGRLFRGIRRTNQETRVAQFVRHRLEVGGGVCIEAVASADAKLQRSASVGAHVKGIVVVVVYSPRSKGEADLLQMVHTSSAGFVRHVGIPDRTAGLTETGQRPSVFARDEERVALHYKPLAFRFDTERMPIVGSGQIRKGFYQKESQGPAAVSTCPDARGLEFNPRLELNRTSGLSAQLQIRCFHADLPVAAQRNLPLGLFLYPLLQASLDLVGGWPAAGDHAAWLPRGAIPVSVENEIASRWLLSLGSSGQGTAAQQCQHGANECKSPWCCCKCVAHKSELIHQSSSSASPTALVAVTSSAINEKLCCSTRQGLGRSSLGTLCNEIGKWWR